MRGKWLITAWIAPMALVSARINLPTCWDGGTEQCVRQDRNGTWCYYPSVALGEERLTNCSISQGHGATDFTLAMEVHLRSRLSVAHYSGVGNELLGGAEWPIPDPPGIVRLCVSGLGKDGNYRTSCTNVQEDNRMPLEKWCSVNLGQPNLQDGCYPPPSDPLALSPYSSIAHPSSTTNSDGTQGARTIGSGIRRRHSSTSLQYALPFSFILIYVIPDFF